MSANTSPNPPRPGLPMPVQRVAEICQLTVSDIYRAHTPEMGSPGHFIYPKGATRQSYTLEGLCALVEGLQAAGHDLEAKILQVEIGRLRQAPAIAPAPAGRVVSRSTAGRKASPARREVESWAAKSERRLEEIQGGQAA